jgi:ABC-type Fe3+/spermidine/putrescine transport system ATPase subunit
MSATPFVKASGLAVEGRLDDIGFEWARGSTVAILGPSGSGKTTLLRLLAGFEAPDNGQLAIDGVLVSSAGRVLNPPEERRLAFAFQEPALMPHMDAMANVYLGTRGTKPDRMAAAQQALIDVGLKGFDRRRVWQLSGGEAQRVQLARTLASDASMLLLDEPFASVDRMCRADLLSRIGGRLKSDARNGVTAIVTHDPADARDLADLIMVLKAGRIVALGNFEQIASGSYGTWPAQFLLAGLGGREIA